MKFKVGDEVLVKVQIVEDGLFVYGLKTTDGILITVKKDGVIPIPDMTAEEAWEIVRKLKQMNEDELLEAFRTNVEYLVLRDFTPQQAKAKIEAWETEKEIKVGDEVALKSDPCNNDYKFFVTYIDKERGRIGGWSRFDGGVFAEREIKRYQKTGLHIDIDGLLRKIGEMNDEVSKRNVS